MNSPSTKLLAGVVVVVVLAGTLTGILVRSHRRTHADLVTHTAHYERLELDIVTRGELESADNRDIYCRVKAGTKNSTIATTIKSVVDEGARVRKGDLLVELDDSGLQEQFKQQKIVLDKAEADKVLAEEEYKIVQSQNDSDLQSAETAVELAHIDLRKYLEGDYPVAIKDVEGRVKTADSDLEMERDRTAWAWRMVKKGYQTINQAAAEQSRLESLEIALGKVREESRVLTDPKYGTRKRTETDLVNKLAEARSALHRVKCQALAKEAQARCDRALKRSVQRQERAHYQEIEAEIAKCRLEAPQDGMVVYCLPEQARRGGGSQQSIIAQGEPVREGQKLMQIPDLNHMLVNTVIHEALVARVRTGLPAQVHVDAWPDHVFTGHVTQVATVASQQDWYSADQRVFNTRVAIDEAAAGLRPGMNAEITIEIGETMKVVLAVPVEALVGSVEMGNRRLCYILSSEGVQERDVIVGLSNKHMVEIKEGLYEGEQVVLNPPGPSGEGPHAPSATASRWQTGPAPMGALAIRRYHPILRLGHFLLLHFPIAIAR